MYLAVRGFLSLMRVPSVRRNRGDPMTILAGATAALGDLSSAPRNLVGTLSADQRLTLRWDAPPAAGAATTYEVHEFNKHPDDTLKATVAAPTRTSSTLQPGSLEYAVRAVSPSGQRGRFSNTVLVEITSTGGTVHAGKPAGWDTSTEPETHTAGSLFTLSRWSLTLDYKSSDQSSDPGPRDVFQPALNTFTDPTFSVQGHALVMIAHVKGEPTSGSEAARCEFREMRDASGKDAKAAWSMDDGKVHQLTVTEICDATAISSGGRREVIVGQIHDAGGTPPVYLTVNQNRLPGRLDVFKTGPNDGTLLTGIGPDTVYSYRITTNPTAKTVEVWACLGADLGMLARKRTYPFSAFGGVDNFFKAGAYNKEKASGGHSGFAKVVVSRLDLR
jgi:hypothetical protein